ncbi:MAG: NUDIX domain-containing protein [Candidatus Sericytochromatia bacterium]|nr:NUDIX domain-containing protein [Candidatus Sericytochromatia bacterium]
MWYDSAKPCATVIVEDENQRVLLVKRGIQPFLGLWNLPGGFLEADEHPGIGAVREVYEETGFAVELIELVGIYIGHWDADGDVTRAHNSLNVAYRAKIVGGEWRSNEESTEMAFFHADELPPSSTIAYANHRRTLDDWSFGRTAVLLPGSAGLAITEEVMGAKRRGD